VIWKDPDFLAVYQAELNAGIVALESDARLQEQRFATELGRSGGGFAGVHLVQTVGGIASTLVSGYVNRALSAFDHGVATLGAEIDEADIDELNGRIEAEIARRVDTLPSRLEPLLKLDPGMSLGKKLAEQAPMNARRILTRRVANERAGLRYRRRQQEVAERAVFVSHSAADKVLAKALQRELKAYLGGDVEVFVSSDLSSIRGGADWKDRLMGRLRTCRVAVTLATPSSIDRPWVNYETGIVDGRERVVIPCVARGLRFANLDPPLGIRHGRELGDPEAAEALFREVRDYLGLPEVAEPPVVKQTVSEARRPTLGGDLSELARSVCETISACSKRGDHAKDDRIETEAFAAEHRIGMPELLAVLGELENLGWIRADKMRIGPSGHIPRFFTPTPAFYLDTEAALGGDDPGQDARTLAAAAVQSGEAMPGSKALGESLGWELRRTNLALHELKRHVSDSLKGDGFSDYAFLHVTVTLGLRAFARTHE
jgi:hypothetical protein